MARNEKPPVLTETHAAAAMKVEEKPVEKKPDPPKPVAEKPRKNRPEKKQEPPKVDPIAEALKKDKRPPTATTGRQASGATQSQAKEYKFDRSGSVANLTTPRPDADGRYRRHAELERPARPCQGTAAGNSAYRVRCFSNRSSVAEETLWRH